MGMSNAATHLLVECLVCLINMATCIQCGSVKDSLVNGLHYFVVFTTTKIDSLQRTVICTPVTITARFGLCSVLMVLLLELWVDAIPDALHDTQHD